MKTAEQMWTDFSDCVMPNSAPDVQRVEMRRSFYAGLFALLGEFQAIGDDAVSEEQGMEYLDHLHKEVHDAMVEMVVSDMKREGRGGQA